MGKVLVPITVENQYDLFEAGQGRRKPEDVRRADIADALVDTGATSLLLPRRLIHQLGLLPLRKRTVRTISTDESLEVFGLVQLTIMGRQCPLDVTALPDDRPALVGQVPLELLDFVVDPRAGRLIPNPAHGGEWMLEAYSGASRPGERTL